MNATKYNMAGMCILCVRPGEVVVCGWSTNVLVRMHTHCLPQQFLKYYGDTYTCNLFNPPIMVEYFHPCFYSVHTLPLSITSHTCRNSQYMAIILG